jgi:hypothetical protein
MTITIKNRHVTDFEVEDVDPRDYPDFCDAHIAYACYADTGTPLDDSELEELNNSYPELVNELAFEYYM